MLFSDGEKGWPGRTARANGARLRESGRLDVQPPVSFFSLVRTFGSRLGLRGNGARFRGFELIDGDQGNRIRMPLKKLPAVLLSRAEV